MSTKPNTNAEPNPRKRWTVTITQEIETDPDTTATEIESWTRRSLNLRRDTTVRATSTAIPTSPEPPNVPLAGSSGSEGPREGRRVHDRPGRCPAR